MSRCWIVVILAGSLFIGIPGCGGDGQDGNGTAPGTGTGDGPGIRSETDEPPAVEGPMTPKKYGDAAAGIQADAIKEVVALMAADLEIEELRTKLGALKEGCIEKLIEIGRKRLEMSDPEKKDMDFGIMGGYGKISKDLMKRFNELYAKCVKDTRDFELTNLISSFNVLTQYANFELLKKQEPEEAKRLGLE